MINEKITKKYELVEDILKLGFTWDERLHQYGLIKGINYYRVDLPDDIFLIGLNKKSSDLTSFYHSKFDEGGNLKTYKTLMGLSAIGKYLKEEFKYDIRRDKIKKLLGDD